MKLDRDQNFSTRLWNRTEDYPILYLWWKKHSWTPMAKEFLPENGLIVSSDESPLLAGFIYKTDSKIAWFEFIVSNPDSSPLLRARALDLLIEETIKRCSEMGFKMIYSNLSHEGLMNKMVYHGFIKGAENCMFTKVLG